MSKASLNSIGELRAKIAQLYDWHERDQVQAPDLAFGIPKGAITSICGPGKTEWLVQFLAENSKINVAWIESKLSIYPLALLQRKIGLDRVLFVEAGEQALWALQQAIRSQLFGAVVFTGEVPEARVLRRLQVSAEKSDSILFLLSRESQRAWPVSVQLRVYRQEMDGPLKVHVVRKRA